MATNIEITAQLNQMLTEQNKLLLVQAKIQKGQLAIMQQMAAAMGQVDVSAMNESLKGVSDQLEAAEQAAKQFGQTTQSAAASAVTSQTRIKNATNEAAAAFDAAADAAEKYKVNVAAAAAEGAVKGFQFTFSALKGIGGILDTVVRKFSQFAMSVLRFPIGIWNFLFEKATSGGGGGDLRQTLENIRKEFGDLSRNSSKAIIDMAKSMKGELANTGLSVFRTFGNLAERLKTVLELAKALGPLFNNVVARGLIKSAEATLAFQKGLGLSNEQMKTIARTALISGTSVDESLREMSNYAIQLGESFGLNAMEISRDMAEMEGDMKHFGGLTRKELGETAVYAKKLGMEVKSLAGIMDQFDNLDSAAEAAARLNQQFGMQIETMRLLKMENPAERMDYLRQSLERTGRSFESLDRRSQAYLATQVGLSQEEAALAFAQENRGLSLDQIKKKSAEAEKKQLSQAEALQKLAASIERLVKGGGGGAKSLFEAFVQGFERAIFRSREFRQIMRNIRMMLRSTRLAGMQVGRAFVEMFPGVKGILQSLGDLFNPDRWKRTLSKVVDAFKDFFKELQTNPEAGLKNLFDRLKKAFFDHFDASSGAGRKLIENFKLFFTTILRAVIGGLKALIPMVFENLTKLIKGINGFLKGEIGLPLDTKSLGGQVMEILSQLWNVIKEAWPPLWEAIKELFSIVFSKVEAWYEENKLKIWGFLFGPAIARSIAGAIAASLTQAAVKGIGAAATSSAVQGAGRAFVSRLTGVTQLTERDITSIDRKRPPPIPAALRKAPTGVPRTPPVPPPAAEGGLTGFIKRLSEVNRGDIVKAGFNLVLISAFMAGALIPFLVLFYFVIENFKQFSPGDIAKGVVVMVAAGGLIVVMGLLTKALKTINPAELGQATVALGVAASFLFAIGVLMFLAVSAFKQFTIEQVGVTVSALGAGAILFTAMAGTFAALAILGAAISKTAGAAAAFAGAGLIAAGLMLAGIGTVMYYTIDAFKDIKPEDVDKTVIALSAGTVLFVALAGAFAVFAGLGAAIVASGGAAAGAAVVGLVAAGALIIGMVPMIKSVSEQIRQLPSVDEEFTKKLGVVTSILEALGTFVNIFVKVSLAFAFATMIPLLLTAVAPILAPLAALISIFAMYKLPDLMSGLVDLFADTIKAVADRVNEIQPDRLRLLQALGPVMESIGVLITALQPPASVLLIGSIFPFSTAETIRNYFVQLLPVLTGENGLIAIAARLTRELGGISAANFNAEAVKGFGSIISSMATMMQAFSSVFSGAGEGVGSYIVRGLAAAASFGMSEMVRPTEAQETATKLSSFVAMVSGIMTAFSTSGLFSNIQNIIETAGSSVRGLSDEAVKGLGPISQMISSIFSFIGSFTENLKIDPAVVEAIANGSSTEGIAAAERVATNLPANIATSIDTILDSIRSKIGPIISSLMTAITGYSKADIERASAGATAIMSILTGFSSVMSSLKELGTTETLGTTGALSTEPPPVLKNFDPDAVRTMITSLSHVVNAIFGSGNVGMIKTIVDSLINSGISRLPRGIGEKAKALVDILGMISIVADPTFAQAIQSLSGGPGVQTSRFGNIDNIMAGAANIIRSVVNNLGGLFTGDVIHNLGNFTKSNMGRLENVTQVLSSVSNIAGSINSGLSTTVLQAQTQLVTIGTSIHDMIARINGISTSLNTIEPLNLIADLERFGNILGVGRNSAITIRNDNFTITVNLNVTLDARDLEAVLVERSRLGRNRFVIGADRGTPAPRGAGGG